VPSMCKFQTRPPLIPPLQVHLADAGAQASLSALGTGLPSLAELHVSGMEPEVLAPHTALLTRLTHLSHEVRGGSKPQGSLFYGLICDAVHARTAATQQGSSPANQPPSQQLLPFMSLQELSLPGVSLPWHILAALSSFSQLSHVSLHSLVKPDHLGHAYLSTTTDKLAPSLQCISLKYMSVSEAARMPGLASVSGPTSMQGDLLPMLVLCALLSEAAPVNPVRACPCSILHRAPAAASMY
jgi:hypothetical protein